VHYEHDKAAFLLIKYKANPNSRTISGHIIQSKSNAIELKLRRARLNYKIN
jgi:hypothetical protein